MRVIGVTGGIASGKSTLARMLAVRGVVHVDADALVHRLIAHDAATKAAIADAFPGCTTRAMLAEHIAQHPKALATLEAILHPRVRAAEKQAIAQARRQRRRGVILDVPLMFETGADELCDLVITVSTPLAMRRRRAFKRSGMTQAKWERLIARQWPEADRCALADLVIPSTLGKAAMQRQAARYIHEFL